MALRKLFSRGRNSVPAASATPATPAARDDATATTAGREAAPPARESAPAAPRDRRLVSGERLLGRCSLELPRTDPFSGHRLLCEGYIAINVRGGSLYLPESLGERTVQQALPHGEVAEIKRFTVYPEAGDPVILGAFGVRYLKTREGRSLTGHVLRFVGLSEVQMDLLNGLAGRLPHVDGNEESAIPIERLARLKQL